MVVLFIMYCNVIRVPQIIYCGIVPIAKSNGGARTPSAKPTLKDQDVNYNLLHDIIL